MTLETTISRASFAGNDATTVFPFPYFFLADADLVVISRVTATGVETTKTLTTHYTVAGAGDDAGGSVTMLTAPATGTTLTIYRDPAATQGLDLVENDSLPAESVEEALDRSMMVNQRLKDLLDRSISLPEGYTAAFDLTLPPLLTADKTIAINATGDGFTLGPSSEDVEGAYANGVIATEQAALAAASVATTVGLVTDHAALTVTHGATGAIVGTTNTQTLSNKTFSDAPTIAEIATPSTPSSGFVKIYFKSDGKLYTKNDAGAETALGAGAGGINYITANSDSESGTTGWATYADAAGTDPVNGTAGSPASTLTASASSPLRGLSSFLLTKSAANRQGEGASFDFTIDAADKSKVLSITFDYLASAAFVTGDSSDIRVWIYDVTNAVLIQPNPHTVQMANGTFQATFPASTSTSYRLIMHIATTNASAWTFQFDNVSVGPKEIVFSPAMSDWIAFTPVVTGLGTVTGLECEWKRVGDEFLFQGKLTSGTSTGVEARISMPFTTEGVTKIPTIMCVGFGAQSSSTARSSYILAEPNVAYLTFGTQAAGNASLTKLNGNSFLSSGDTFSFFARVPIAGWSTNVTASNGRVVKVSSYVQARVTGSAPTALGQYRSYLRSGTSVFTETNGSPTVTPTIADGFKIYSGNAYTAADTNNQPTCYEVFVGKNKYVKINWFKSAGFVGSADASLNQDSAIDYGYYQAYDPSTGIVTVTGMRARGGAIVHSSGLDPAAIGTALTVAWFDITVSENALSIQSDRVGPSCAYTTTSTASIASTTTTWIDFDTKIFDTHNAVLGLGGGEVTVTGTGWRYVAPQPGKYLVTASVHTAAASTVTLMKIYKNGTVRHFARSDAFPNGACIIEMVVGDYIQISEEQNAAGALSSAAGANVVEICKIAD